MKNKFEIRGDITAIFLESPKYGSLETIIDTVDLPWVQSFPNTWYAHWNPKSQYFYVRGNITEFGKLTGVLLHRWLMGIMVDGVDVDHRNLNTLDNRRSSNLRVCSRSENMQNRKGAQINNMSSGIRGVSWDKFTSSWKVHIKLNGKMMHIGRFTELSEAEKAVKEARAKLMPFSKEGAVAYDA